MSYTPTNWSSGDIITATKLNKIEQGLSNTNIIANPTLAGTETDLTSLQVGDTKYKVGGGLPSYTNADLGKSLKLADSGETTTETVTTISEQTITTRGDKFPASIQIESAYPWNDGDTIHLVIDGESQDCVVEPGLGGHEIIASLSGGSSMVIADVVDIYGPSGETYTISATKEAAVPLAAPAWVSGGSSGGGVLDVHATVENTTVTLDKTWREIADADLAVISLSIPGPGGTQNPGGTQKGFVYETVCEGEDRYSVSAFSIIPDGISPMYFITDTEDGYPSMTIGG